MVASSCLLALPSSRVTVVSALAGECSRSRGEAGGPFAREERDRGRSGWLLALSSLLVVTAAMACGGADGQAPTSEAPTSGTGGAWLGGGDGSGGGASDAGGVGSGAWASGGASGSATGGGNADVTAGASAESGGGPGTTGGTGGTVAGAGGTVAGTGGVAAATGGSATGGQTAGRGLSLYYVRHAETLANVAEDPSSLSLEEMDEFTALGARQVEALTTYLLASGIAPDAVLVSPTRRAQRTISPFLVASGRSGEIWGELAEASSEAPSFGPLPTAPTYYEYYQASLEAENLRFRDEAARSMWRNDTYEAGLFMVMTARDGILSAFGQTGQTLLVTGHAVAGTLLIGLLLGEDMTGGPTDLQTRERLYLLNTGIQRLAQDPTTGRFSIVDRNINAPETG